MKLVKMKPNCGLVPATFACSREIIKLTVQSACKRSALYCAAAAADVEAGEHDLYN
jgi:hypothetical protein